MAKIISLVSYPFLPAKVGGQKGVALFNKYFSQYHELICVTTKKNDPAAAEGYKVLNILSNAPYRYINVFYFFTLRKIIRENHATHLILEHPYYGWLGILLKWFCGVKLILHSHNIEGLRWKTLHKWWWRILWIYEKYTHRAADFNFFIHDDDREYGIKNFGLKTAKCITMTYGIEWKSIPAREEIQNAKQQLRNKFTIGREKNILLFNGAFNYSPNLDALKNITDFINPILQQKKDFQYTIIICGRDIPENISTASFPNIIIVGFVDDIGLYFKGADIFLNPITEGGGIKTKLVEALGYNMNAVSTANGAIGINESYCNGKLLVCRDNNWQSFAELIKEASRIHEDTPAIYFEHFYWGYTTAKAAAFVD
jgi:hypothetical protein